MWAHAEYIKLVRSVADGRVFDAIEPVAARYGRPTSSAASGRPRLEVWSAKRRIAGIAAGATLRIVSDGPFTLEWKAAPAYERETEATATGVSVWYVDLQTTDVTEIVFRFVYGDGSLSDQYVIAVRAAAATLS